MFAHITTKDAWQRAQEAGEYLHPSLATDGFIHCSMPTPEQLLVVADAHFAGQRGLVLLVIDPDRLQAEVKYEEFEDSGNFFPHVYGPINPEAVVRVLEFVPEQEGSFRLPEAEAGQWA